RIRTAILRIQRTRPRRRFPNIVAPVEQARGIPWQPTRGPRQQKLSSESLIVSLLLALGTPDLADTARDFKKPGNQLAIRTLGIGVTKRYARYLQPMEMHANPS